MKTFEEYGYVVKNGVLAFQRGPLSNFWGGFKNQGKQPQFTGAIRSYICNEQFYMSQKASFFADDEKYYEILKETNPHNHQKLGQQVKDFDLSIWNKFKYYFMKKGLHLKFNQNEDLAQFLLSTGDLVLVEAAPWDKSWGCGTGYDDERTFDPAQWQGDNLLGKALMEVREELKKATLFS